MGPRHRSTDPRTTSKVRSRRCRAPERPVEIGSACCGNQDGDGVAEMRTVFIDHLNSPYGIVLVGNDLYVADTDELLKFAYTSGATRLTEPGVKLTELPAQSP